MMMMMMMTNTFFDPLDIKTFSRKKRNLGEVILILILRR